MRRIDSFWLFVSLFFALSIPVNANPSPESGSSKVEETCNLPAPQNFTLLSLVGTSATFTWNAVPGASYYYLHVQDLMNGQATPLFVTTNTYATYLLPPNPSTYEAWVEAVCANGQPGTSSIKVHFSTPDGPVIAIDEIVQRPAPCTLPESGDPRNPGLFDTFTLPNTPSGGAPVMQYVRINWGASGTYVKFLVWGEGGNLHFQEKDKTIKITRNPPGNQGLVSNIMYSFNGINFFRIGATMGSNTVTCIINYYGDAEISSCSSIHNFAVNPDNGWTDNSEIYGETDKSIEPEIHILQNQVVPTTTFSISPNPVPHEAYLSYAVPETTPITISLYNTLGRLEQQIRHPESIEPGEYSQYLDMEPFPPGVYYVVLQTKEGRFTNTLIKQ